MSSTDATALQLLYDKLMADEKTAIAEAKARTRVLVGQAVQTALAGGMSKGEAASAIRCYTNWTRFKGYLDAAPVTPVTKDDLTEVHYSVDGRSVTFFESWPGFDRGKMPPVYRDSFVWPEENITVDFTTGADYASNSAPFVFAARTELDKLNNELFGD